MEKLQADPAHLPRPTSPLTRVMREVMLGSRLEFVVHIAY